VEGNPSLEDSLGDIPLALVGTAQMTLGEKSC